MSSVPALPSEIIRVDTFTAFVPRFEELIASACAAIPDGEEYLILSLDTEEGTQTSRVARMVESQAELRADLEELTGDTVALGICPDFTAGDHEGLISRSKGGIVGPR